MAPSGTVAVATQQLLKKRLLNVDTKIRDAAADQAFDMGVPVGPLSAVAAEQIESEFWFVRSAAARALGRLSSVESCEESAEIAAKLLEHEDLNVREMAIKALGGQSDTSRRKDEEDVGAQAAYAAALRLAHENARVRRSAIQALMLMGEHASPHAGLLGRCIGDSNLGVRNAAIEAFRTLGSLAAAGSEDLCMFLEHDDAAVRRSVLSAVVALVGQAGSAAASAAVPYLASPNPVTRAAAANCLVELGVETAGHCEKLIPLLEDEDVRVRRAAANALAAAAVQGSVQMKPILKSLLHLCDTHASLGGHGTEVRKAATHAMRALSCASASFAKVAGARIVYDDTQMTVYTPHQRFVALCILGGAGANVKPYLSDVARMLEDDDFDVKRAAVEALGDLGAHAEKIGGEVARRLHHQNPDVRRFAADALGHMGPHAERQARHIEALIDTEDDADVKRVAERAMLAWPHLHDHSPAASSTAGMSFRA